VAGSGFGGKGLDRLDKERDAREKAERKAYGEEDKDEKMETVGDAAAPGTGATAGKSDDMFNNFKVEVKRGPAPDSSKGLLGVAGAAAAARRLAHAKEEEKLQASLREAEAAAARAGKDTPAHKQASSVVAKLNAQLRAAKLVAQSQLQAETVGTGSAPRPSGDSTEFHAIIPINDYPQKARWRVTNKETMVQVSVMIQLVKFVAQF
jgi:ATP-dependent RNA helicase DDX46/PRP5